MAPVIETIRKFLSIFDVILLARGLNGFELGLAPDISEVLLIYLFILLYWSAIYLFLFIHFIYSFYLFYLFYLSLLALFSISENADFGDFGDF